jgi:hypothetical protein
MQVQTRLGRAIVSKPIKDVDRFRVYHHFGSSSYVHYFDSKLEAQQFVDSLIKNFNRYI